ncbi:MAG TPA: phenylpyruvate tautomerase MIF-related protein [Polyangia bacterium]|nr:phenylpyruvate tautomerase MIF-related protein [Polyangia bacterium]
MPLCQVFTNVAVPSPAPRDALLSALSRAVAQRFDKPERWVMTCVVPEVGMTFGGDPAPAAFVVVRNIGQMKPEDTEALSRDICERLEAAIGVPRARVYIDFADAADYLWGWNGSTFA